MTLAELERDAAEEQPILWLGMAGFSPQQRTDLAAFLSRRSGLSRWRVCAFGEADAWWVNGAKVRVMPDGNLKVAAGLPTEHALNLNLSDVDRPVAFAAPMASPEFEPRYAFDPGSGPSIDAVLLQFERWLWLLRAQFVLGAQIIRRGPQLRHGIYHVSAGGRLLAVLDFRRGKSAISSGVHPVDLWEARWDKRPIGAGDPPQGFIHQTPGQLAWAYVRRTDRDMLPNRYRDRLIYYRHAPRVPLGWLRDSQLMLLRELFIEPGTIESLRQRTGLPASHVDHDLTCLYYAGALTTTRSKAADPTAGRHDSQPLSVGPEIESLLGTGPHADFQNDLTAPVMLEALHRPRPPGAADDAAGPR